MGLRTVLVIAAVGLPGFAIAQAGVGDGDRASTPPGTSRDGSAPGDGAIKGGAILPGESGGVPDAAGTAPPSAAARCYELTGTLREQCIRDARSAGVGGTAAPRVAPNVRDPAMAPPPQNPR